MTERIDHAAEAETCYQFANIMTNGTTIHQREQVMRQAQVHATLALVEQQRIANLIALYGEDSGEGSARRQLHPDIAAALGVTR